MGSSTKHTYASGIKQFILFCLSKGIVTPRSPLLPATEITLLYFVGHLSKTVSYATVKTHMASISYLHVIFQIPFNMGRMQLLEKRVKGLKCLKGEKLRDRRLITVKELEFLHEALRPQFTDSVDNVMLWAAFTLPFLGFYDAVNLRATPRSTQPTTFLEMTSFSTPTFYMLNSTTRAVATRGVWGGVTPPYNIQSAHFR